MDWFLYGADNARDSDWDEDPKPVPTKKRRRRPCRCEYPAMSFKGILRHRIRLRHQMCIVCSRRVQDWRRDMLIEVTQFFAPEKPTDQM